MSNNNIVRPALDDVLAVWKQCLIDNGLPPEMLWIFAENLCIESSSTASGSFNYGFQTKFTPPDDDALDIAYDHFSDTEARIVFYRLGSSADKKSVCILLCDPWFEGKDVGDGFVKRDDWKISFRPGQGGNIEEVTDLSRWVRRAKSDQTFHDFDFSMSLETIEEIKLNGRPLLPYERMAQKMLGRLRRVMGQPE
jgi:hypothetical protein